jgi:uncharacterized Zn finger protein
MTYGDWKRYTPVSEIRLKSEKAIAKAMKSGHDIQPVRVSGRTIARTFWGKSWCKNLEAYSDFSNRLPRGRTYLRNGSVIDLKIEAGKVCALVIGSSLYQVEIGIAPVQAMRWKSLVKQSTGSIASLVDLLQGKLSLAVMESMCHAESGLFPAPKDIRLNCSCPDWATMCKHVAAVLYGIGTRLDEDPELLFTLRQVKASDLVTQATEFSATNTNKPVRTKILDDSLLTDIFDLEIEGAEVLGKKKTPAKKHIHDSLPTDSGAKRKTVPRKTTSTRAKKKNT